MPLGNQLVQQGLLNRVITSVVVAAFPALNVTSPFMAKGQAVLTFDGQAVEQVGTATGIVNSPAPFVMANIEVNILRSQGLAAAFYAQWQASAVIGTVTAYPDSTALGPFTLSNCSIQDIAPGPFDGQDPTTKVSIKGVYYVNASLWAGA